MANDDIINLMAIANVEEAEIEANQPNRGFHHRDNPFDLSDSNFIKQYCLTKPMVEELIALLEPVMISATRKNALDVKDKVLTALNFFACGSYQNSIGNNIIAAISQSSVSRCIIEATESMNTPQIFQRFVNFPNNFLELRTIQTNFFNKYQFPGVIGCIDCTHIAIVAPSIENNLYPEEIYVNRKGYHSINVQLICDANLKILNVCAQYPGSTNDSFIWGNCEVNDLMQNLHRNGHTSLMLLGDSGYPLRPWLLTPLNNIPQPDTPEDRYNKRLMTVRSTIERCNGLLKTRFRCLLKHRVLHYNPERASKIINTCVMLHNFCIEAGAPPPPEIEENFDFGMLEAIPHIDNEVVHRVNPQLVMARRVQQQIIRNYFTE